MEEKEGRRAGQNCDVRRTPPAIAGLDHGGGGQARNLVGPLKLPCPHLDFSPLRPRHTSDFRAVRQYIHVI